MKAGLILTIPVIGFCFYSGLSPVAGFKELRELAEADKGYQERYDSVFNSSSLKTLIREKTYKKALVKISDNDSICLQINLHDSLASLSINGVIIDRANITGMKIDHLLQGLPNLTYMKLFSEPSRVNKNNATIKKEPIVVHKAPKDTVEALNQIFQPDTLIQDPVFVEMKLDHKIEIIFEQDSTPSFKEKKDHILFRSKILLRELTGNIADFIRFKKPEYIFKIVIRLPAADLSEIYRALPDKGLVVIRFP